MNAYTDQSTPRLWQSYRAPITNSGWAHEFEQYVSRRWFDSEHPLACAVEAYRGEDAYNPQLEPVVRHYRATKSFDLDDVSTYLLWMEYLSEYSERRRAWQAFEEMQGEQSTLSWWKREEATA